MTAQVILLKLTSRKFWIAIITIMGILGLFGVADTTIESVTSLLLILIPGITYIFTEGRVDAAAVSSNIDFEALIKQIARLLNISIDSDTMTNIIAAIKVGDKGSSEDPA